MGSIRFTLALDNWFTCGLSCLLGQGDRSRFRWTRPMRLHRQTIVESLTMVAVLAILAGFIFIPDSATSTRRSLERRARNWKPSVDPIITDRSLIATDIALNGESTTRHRLNHTAFTFVKRKDGKYDVQFSTGGCLGGCELTRIAEFSHGVIILDGAVAEYVPRTYDTLYAIRIDNDEYLLPAESLPDFERDLASGSDDWKWYVHARGGESNEPIGCTGDLGAVRLETNVNSSVPVNRVVIWQIVPRRAPT